MPWKWGRQLPCLVNDGSTWLGLKGACYKVYREVGKVCLAGNKSYPSHHYVVDWEGVTTVTF